MRVFISYSHDSPEHAERVLDLSKRLRGLGIDCWIDQYEVSPPEGWPKWMVRQVKEADFVLVVCTETYLKRVEGKEEVVSTNNLNPQAPPVAAGGVLAFSRMPTSPRFRFTKLCMEEDG